MSYNDKKFGQLFPTRTGTPSGSANERQMLDAMGGSAGYRKRFQTNADGSMTQLNTRNGAPEFITTGADASTCDVGMDNGAVNMISASWLMDANSNVAGKLLQTANVAQYLALPAITDVAPVIDVIHPPKSQGTAPTDGTDCKSFKAGNYAKKRLAVQCPPSIFTGKMRLYVQALYGRHEAIDLVISPTVGTDVPYLIFGSGGDPLNQSPGAVNLHTSCGIFYEAGTSKHYLISVGVGATVIYPLLPSACAAKLYPKLLDTTISAANRDRIEAYILGQSLPDSANAVTFGNTVLSVSAMGYGWHFNWEGSKCDLVVTSLVAAPSGGTENESTHYQLSFAHDTVTGIWSSTAGVIEGPTRWFNQKHTHVLTFPLWDGTGMFKLGAKTGTPYGDAPYYCFYRRDQSGSFPDTSTLQVCRFKVTTATESAFATRFPAYLNPSNLFTEGADSMDYRTQSAYSSTTIALKCGAASVSAKTYSRSENCSTHTSPTGPVNDPLTDSYTQPHTMFGVPPAYNYNTGNALPIGALSVVSDPYEGSISVYNGAANTPGTGTSTPNTVAWPPGNYYAYSPVGNELCSWSYSLFSKNVLATIGFISTIPYYDAEAIYLLGTTTTSTAEVGTDYTVASGRGFFNSNAIGLLDGPAPTTYYGHYGVMTYAFTGGTGAARNNPIPDVTSTDTLGISGYGPVAGITIPTPSAFFSVAHDVVPVIISGVAAASGTAAYSAEAALDKGNAPAALAGKPFAYVGWA